MLKRLLLLLALCSPLSATTYFVCAATGSPCNASDANNGTTKTTAWLHAPGMPNFTGTYVHAAGDHIILRGGDTWHRSSGTPATGGVWTWSNSGTNGNSDYLGVDLTWFNAGCGASWCRPIFNGDNPLSTSFVASCSFTDDSVVYATISGNFVTLDNFEFTGDCQTTASFVSFVNLTGTNDTASNNYFHGWTLSTAVTDDRKFIVSSSAATNILTLNVVDGQDSSGEANYVSQGSSVANCWNGSGTPPSPCATGWAIAGTWGEVSKNVVRWVTQVYQGAGIDSFHDNFIEFAFEPCCARHGNVFEAASGAPSGTLHYYNNLVRNINEGVNQWLTGNTIYAFGNVSETDAHATPDPNCYLLSPNGTSNVGVVITVFFYNNTMDGTCAVNGYGGNGNTPHWAAGSAITFANNHTLDRTGIFSGTALFTCQAGSTCTTETDSGGEIFQTTTVANGQGYTLANDRAPTLLSNATVGAGVNEAGSCATFSTDSALCSGTSKGVAELSGSGGLIASYPAITVNARPTAWDAGAYQFSAAVVTPAPALVGVE